MHIIKLNLQNGSASVDSESIKVNEIGGLADSIAKLCSPPIYTDKGWARYRLLGKASTCGKSASCVIEIGEGRVCGLTLLFDLIEFFEFSVLESKVLKAFEKSLNLKFTSNHPSTAFLENCEWGRAIFFYDAKQGDLSFEMTFWGNSNEPI